MSFYGLLMTATILAAIMLSMTLYQSATYLGSITSSYYYQSSSIQLQAYSEMYSNSGSLQLLNYTYALDGIRSYQDDNLLYIPGMGYIKKAAAIQNPQ